MSLVHIKHRFVTARGAYYRVAESGVSIDAGYCPLSACKVDPLDTEFGLSR